jgi:hypothetical protein
MRARHPKPSTPNSTVSYVSSLLNQISRSGGLVAAGAFQNIHAGALASIIGRGVHYLWFPAPGLQLLWVLKMAFSEPPQSVFLSSTGSDLAEVRRSVATLLERDGFRVERMERFGASPATPLKDCLERVRACDLTVALVAHTYGTAVPIEEGGDGVHSYTWYEVGASRRVLSYVHDDLSSWTGPREGDALHAGADPLKVVERIRLLEEFKALLRQRQLDPLDPMETPSRVVVDVGRVLRAPTDSTNPKLQSHPHVIDVDTRMPSTSIRHDDFVGRRRALRDLDDGLDSPFCSQITVIGHGGSGKSHLVQHWLRRLRQDGPRVMLAWSFYGRSEEGSSPERYFAWASAKLGLRAVHADATQRAAAIIDELKGSSFVMVLDGLEMLQDRSGRIRDGALSYFVRQLELLRAPRQLTVITSRLELATDTPASRRLTLPGLSPEEAEDLLRRRGVAVDKARRIDVETTISRYDGHALGLHILATTCIRMYGGHLTSTARARHELGPTDANGRVHELLSHHARWLQPHLIQALELLSVYAAPQRLDHVTLAGASGPVNELPRPSGVRSEAWAAVLDTLRSRYGPTLPPIPGLTDHLSTWKSTDWRTNFGILRTDHLVGFLDLPKDGDVFLDLHPIVREFFACRLMARSPGAWREIHERIYLFLREVAPRHPERREDLHQLLAAVEHGVAAGQPGRALREIAPRINQHGDDFAITYHANRKLGAHADLLAAEASFFDAPFLHLTPGLEPAHQADLLFWTGFGLCATGRGEEGIANLLRATTLYRAQGRHHRAVEAETMAAEQLLLMGRFEEAAEAARRSQEDVASASRDSRAKFVAVRGRTLAAAVAHCRGEIDVAKEEFKMAEAALLDAVANTPLQAHCSILESMEGYRYHDFLLSQRRADEVLQRLKHPPPPDCSELHIGLRHLAQGRALRQLGRLEDARDSLDLACRHIDSAQHAPYVPLALMAIASFLMRSDGPGDLAKAGQLLQRARGLCQVGQLQLRMADIEILEARLTVLQWKRCPSSSSRRSARDCWKRARDRVASIGYALRYDVIALLGRELGLPTVVYAHGFASGPDCSKATQVCGALRRLGYTVVAPDLNDPFAQLTMTRTLGRLERTCNEIGEPDAVLVGSSFGGYAAALLAEKMGPSRLRGVVLLAPAFDFLARGAAQLGEARLQEWRETPRRVAHLVHGEATLLYDFVEDLTPYSPRPDLSGHRLLILHGLWDEEVPFEVSGHICRGAKQQRVGLPCDHTFLGQFEAVASHLDDFLYGSLS